MHTTRCSIPQLCSKLYITSYKHVHACTYNLEVLLQSNLLCFVQTFESFSNNMARKENGPLAHVFDEQFQCQSLEMRYLFCWKQKMLPTDFSFRHCIWCIAHRILVQRKGKENRRVVEKKENYYWMETKWDRNWWNEKLKHWLVRTKCWQVIRLAKALHLLLHFRVRSARAIVKYCCMICSAITAKLLQVLLKYLYLLVSNRYCSLK